MDPHHLQKVQVAPRVLPKIRTAYIADVAHYTGDQGGDQKQLESTLERVNKKELNLWRAFTELGMQADMYQKLAQEYQEERQRIEFALQALKQENREYIDSLDAALNVIAEIGKRYKKQDFKRQREILRQLVSKVVIDEAGQIIRLELHPPFTYLHYLKNGNGGKKKTQPRENEPLEKKTPSGVDATKGSLQVSLGDPTPTQNEHFSPSDASDFMGFLELTSYPQRLILEQLLSDE